jgi:hypothetical protein
LGERSVIDVQRLQGGDFLPSCAAPIEVFVRLIVFFVIMIFEGFGFEVGVLGEGLEEFLQRPEEFEPTEFLVSPLLKSGWRWIRKIFLLVFRHDFE